MLNEITALLTVLHLMTTAALNCVYHDYCIIGSGPGGLQIGYFLHSKRRDYIVFEKTNKSGSFFQQYPRHRKLISINKRHTGRANIEFNLRHDWNSLLSHDSDLRATKYSKELFPNADILIDYLNDYQRKLNINVQFNTDIRNIHQVSNETAPGGKVFKMNDQKNQIYKCRTLIIATGISTPNIPDIPWMRLTKGYESVSIDPEDYEGKSVLILGRGNSAFEIADGIYGSTNFIHIISRSIARFAWSTHYVGDLRAVNNNLLDTYQLKSLDGLAEFHLKFLHLEQKGEKFYVKTIIENNTDYMVNNFALREPYDVAIRALGFKFDPAIFKHPVVMIADKYPAIKANYESVDVENLFFAGTLCHSLDYRKSAGGFIHGFRYTARALHRLMEWRYEHIPWPTVTIPRSQLLNTILKRINEASGIYQMFQNLADIAILSDDGETVAYLQEFPIKLLHQISQYSGITASSVLVLVMEYGKNFSGPTLDVFNPLRATLEPSKAHTANFLHPVIYYYKNLPTDEMMSNVKEPDTLPRPDKIHHIVEDFLTKWDVSISHVLPLRRFLEEVWQTDLRAFFSQACFGLTMTRQSIPEYCAQYYLRGNGILYTAHSKRPST